MTIIRGIIRGKTIELDQKPGLPDGQPVTVTIQAVRQTAEQRAPGDGIRLSAGGWADDSEGLEEYLKWNREQRKIDRPPIEP